MDSSHGGTRDRTSLEEATSGVHVLSSQYSDTSPVSTRAPTPTDCACRGRWSSASSFRSCASHLGRRSLDRSQTVNDEDLLRPVETTPQDLPPPPTILQRGHSRHSGSSASSAGVCARGDDDVVAPFVVRHRHLVHAGGRSAGTPSIEPGSRRNSAGPYAREALARCGR